MSLHGKTVLCIGSSSIGPLGHGSLGRVLGRELLARGANVYFDGSDGRGLAGFADNRLVGTHAQRVELAAFLVQIKPDIVLVALGGNPSGTDTEFKAGLRFVSSTCKNLGSKLVWFGAPIYDDPAAMAVTAQYELLAPDILGSSFHSSLPYTEFTKGRTADLVHFTAAGAERWAAPMLDALEYASSPPTGWALVLSAAAAAAAWAVFRALR